MMKKARYILKGCWVACLCCLLSACDISNEDAMDTISYPEGTSIDIVFGSFMNEARPVSLRSINADEDLQRITNLRLMVFDQSGNFLYSRMAKIENEETAPAGDQAYLPDGNKDGIQNIKTCTTQLLVSSSKRIVHFVANYDWTNYPDDALLEGQSEGQLIPALATGQTAFWQRIELDEIQANALQGKVVKLLRNQSKISIVNEATGAEIIAAKVYNAYNKGTVAPYTFTNLNYAFPFPPAQPTIPANVHETNPSFEKVNGNYEIEVFEHANEGVAPLFVIIQVKDKGFYKIDLKKVSPEGITSLYDMVRNHWYKIRITSISGKGYGTEAEAARNVAGNNLLSSVEFEKYPSISYGDQTLSVGHMDAIITHTETVFKTTVEYSEGFDRLMAYALDDAIYKEYVEKIDLQTSGSAGEGQTKGELSIKVKKIPPNGSVNLQVAVVGTSSKDEKLSRILNIRLTPPYKFNATLTSVGTSQGSEVTISFNVPQSIPSLLFPFDVLIITNELSPIPGQDMNYEIKDGGFYIKYLVKETFRGDKVELKFKRSKDNVGETIELVSDYYDKGTVTLNKNE